MNQESKQSGPGTIEIARFSRVFRTRSMAWPDALFVPIADQVRQALSVADILAQGDSAKREDATLIAERYFSGCLLQDSNYLLSAPGQFNDDCYQIDLGAGLLSFRSMMIAGQGGRTSCFKIHVSGKIREGQYSLQSPPDGPILLNFRESSLQQPEFFSRILAPLCLVNLILRDQVAHPEKSSSLMETIQLTLPFKLADRLVSVLVRRAGLKSPWQVFESSQGQEIGTIPSEHLQDVDLLLTTLAGQLGQPASLPLQPSATAGVEMASRLESGKLAEPASRSAVR